MLGLGFALASAAVSSDFFLDDDNDGLLNGWERHGFGPLNPETHRCDPKHSDIIICFRIRPGMTDETVKPTIDRLKKFYADMPFKNPDGKQGLNLIPIILPPHPDDKGQDYIAFYEKGMPIEWRGLAHGVFVGNSPGGGGQANRPDWCGTGYNWFTIAHEVGHQLGLPHEPLGFGLGSPFHTSLMNYDYSYQLDGEGEKVRFSFGEFASLKMSEDDLNEVLPFSIDRLKFLSNRPHYFSLKSLGKSKTSVDWNRNGVHSETHVRANINDGYSVGLSSNIKSKKVAGAPVLVTDGKTLYMVAPVSEFLNETSPSKDHPATATLFKIDGKKCVEVAKLGKQDVCGDLSACIQNGVLHVSYPSFSTTSLHRFRLDGSPTNSEASPADFLLSATDHLQTTLVTTPAGVKVLATDQKSGRVMLVIGKSIVPLSISSTYAVGAVWNSKAKAIAVAYTEDKDKQKGRILIALVDPQTGKIVSKSPLVVGGEKSPAQTSNRPVILFDTTKAGGPNGAYKVVVKGRYDDPHQPGLNYMCRQIASRDGWWIKMMGNEWANSRSVASAVEFAGDMAYAYRWYGGGEDGMAWISMRASGIEKGIITDFDEVGFIFKKGLRDSLNAVRNEQWPRKGWR
jgi:hypothetical protein